jgi:subtilisin family serine protease
MSKKRRGGVNERRLQFEQFEKRLVMSGQSIAPDIVAILPELELTAPAITQQEVAIQSNEGVANPGLENAAAQAAHIAAEYGLDGAGQTIAVIDSGIAWDHSAFGNGYGEGHKVVGGWDFAENDANPYDDGPAGYHGTHVAGIIGSEDPSQLGVSTGADLVALRVFNDTGAGDLALVEKALQWVIEHKDDYRFPITTVNLSLGSGWDPETTPEWGSLEDEFAKLNQEGIFVSVAAGNRFQQIGEKALSYPAASPYVVPVASHGSDGQLSDFSQRDNGVLVAPGELLRSSVPSHLFGGTRQDPFLTSSGTSMASPYVAGASAILRQANEFVGNFGVTQAQLYQQFVETSDSVFDAATNQYYSRINFRSALEHVITDQYSQQLENATSVGQLNDGDSIVGMIGKLSDVDAIKFTAESSGRLELSIQSTHQLDASVDFGANSVTVDGNRVYLNVEAGQEYSFTIYTGDGTGHYDIQASYQADTGNPNAGQSSPATNLGTIVVDHFNNQQVQGQQPYQMTAARDGVLTVLAHSNTSQQLNFQVLNQHQQLIGSATGSGNIRIDADVFAGESITLIVSNDGTDQTFDLSVANLVSKNGGTVVLHGTNQDDTISVDTTAGFSANINGWQYHWASDSVQSVFVRSHLGNDSIDFSLGSNDDHVSMLTEAVHISNDSFQLTATGFDSANVDSGQGFDRLYFVDSAGRDEISAGRSDDGQNEVSLGTNDDEQRRAIGFEQNYVRSISGNDLINANGTSGADRFGSTGSKGYFLLGDQTSFVFDAFAETQVNGNGGGDVANLHGGPGDDTFSLTPNMSRVSNATSIVQVNGFFQVNALAGTGGNDVLNLTDSIGNDSLYQNNQDTVLIGQGFHFYAHGFKSIRVESVGGFDNAAIHDTIANDRFRFSPGWAQLSSTNLSVRATGFEQVSFSSSAGGRDRATVDGSSGDDALTATNAQVSLRTADGQSLSLDGIARTFVDLRDGNDTVDLIGSLTRDELAVDDAYAEFQSTAQFLKMLNFQDIQFDGNGGGDSVNLDGTIDLLAAIGDQAQVVMDKHRIQLNDFSVLDVESVDQAIANLDIDNDNLSFEIKGL